MKRLLICFLIIAIPEFAFAKVSEVNKPYVFLDVSAGSYNTTTFSTGALRLSPNTTFGTYTTEKTNLGSVPSDTKYFIASIVNDETRAVQFLYQGNNDNVWYDTWLPINTKDSTQKARFMFEDGSVGSTKSVVWNSALEHENRWADLIAFDFSDTNGWRQGKFGNCLLFGGVRQRVHTSVPTEEYRYLGNGEFAISAWVKSSTTETSGYTVAKSWNSTGDINYSISLNISGYLKFDTFFSGAWFPFTLFPKNVWVFVCAVIKADSNGSTITLYQNNEVAVRTFANTNWIPVNTEALSVVIGCYYPYLPDWEGNPNLCWDGYIDEVRIWQRGLTQTEVSKMYYDGATFRNGDLGRFQYYKFLVNMSSQDATQTPLIYGLGTDKQVGVGLNPNQIRMLMRD